MNSDGKREGKGVRREINVMRGIARENLRESSMKGISGEKEREKKSE